jgi:gamma-glutamylcyclotransferase (GGCT)/AIG2-like uncharacterized protein YtfP
MPLLFSYGSLQESKVQLSTFGRRLKGEPDELLGFERSRVQITDAADAALLGQSHYANVRANGSEMSKVSGTVFEVTDAELAAADAYEQPAAYHRVLATLSSGRVAWVYIHAS